MFNEIILLVKNLKAPFMIVIFFNGFYIYVVDLFLNKSF